MTEPADQPKAEVGPRRDRWHKRTVTWLGRPRIWDDVFTRTLANVLSVLILAGLAALAGLITIDQLGWARLIFVVAVVAGVIGFTFLARDNMKRRALWMFVAFALAVGLMFLSFALIAPFVPEPDPNYVCTSECE